MTNEEAIEVIEQDIPCEYDTDLIEALNMAIAALRAEPCEDAVKREAVIQAMYDLCDTGETLKENVWRDNPHIDAIIDTIENLPSATPKQKTGKWIKYAAPRCGEQHYKCTNCDDYVNFGQYGDYYTKDFKFCPHCGAKMEGEKMNR